MILSLTVVNMYELH